MAERPRRINVAVAPETVDALQRFVEREGVTLTEAVRRLVGYGDYVHRAVKDDGGSLVFHGPDGRTRELVLL